MQVFATVDDEGTITGFYPQELFPSPPSGSVEIPETDWKDHLKGNLRKRQSGSWVPFQEALTQEELDEQAAQVAHDEAVVTGIRYRGKTIPFTDADFAMLEQGKSAVGAGARNVGLRFSNGVKMKVAAPVYLSFYDDYILARNALFGGN